MAGEEKPLGGVEFWMQGPVLRFLARGPFELEQVRQLEAAMFALFSSMPEELPFATVIEFRGSMQADESTLVEFEALLMSAGRWRRIPVAVGIIASPEVEGLSSMVPRYEAIFTRHGRKFSHFVEAQECQVWSAQQVAEAREAREREAAMIAERVAQESRGRS